MKSEEEIRELEPSEEAAVWLHKIELNPPGGWSLVGDGQDGQAWVRKGNLSCIWSIARELDGKLWLHVSVSHPSHLPGYYDFVEVKEVFVGSERTALHVFPPRSRHINIDKNCLHLWCCLEGEVTPDFSRGGPTI